MQSLGKNKICLLYAGGLDFKLKEFNQKLFKKWVDNFFELQLMAKVEPYFIDHNQNQNVDWNLAVKIVEIIKKNYDKYYGFVISHNLTDILYISSLVSFMIQNTGKPIIFTAPLLQNNKDKPDISEVNLRTNLINAVQVATLNIAEIGIALDNHLVRATQAQFDFKAPFNFLRSYKHKYLAKIQFDIHLSPYINKRGQRQVCFNTKYNSNIKIINYYPGVQLSDDLDQYAGIFIKGLYQEIPTSWQLPVQIPVYIYNQDLTLEAAIAKFIWVLGQTKEPKQVKKIMAKNLAGEF